MQGHLVLKKRGGLWGISKKGLCRIAAIIGAMALPFCQLPMAQASLEQDRTAYPRFSNELNEAIEQASERHGVPESAPVSYTHLTLPTKRIV